MIEKKDMTAEIANKYLSYDALTGILTRKFKYHNNVITGRRACRPCKSPKADHLEVTLCAKNYPAHRIIWLMVHGNFPKNYVDHIDHIETNNKLSNLREVSKAENNRNSSKRSDNTAGTTGIWIRKNAVNKKYIAEIRDQNSKKRCKSFCSMAEAIAQRKSWEIEFGYHKNHGIFKPL